MNLIGNMLYVPLIDAVLKSGNDLELCDGIKIHVLTDNFRETIRINEAISGRYSESIDHMQVAIAIDPTILLPEDHRLLNEVQAVAIFVAMLIRLATGIPVDIPFWVDAQDDDVQRFGSTQVRTFRVGTRHQYPLDEGVQAENIQILGDRLTNLVDLYVSEGNRNRVVRASEFAFIGFQTFHAPTRLVNHVTFLEALFSTSNTEIVYQLSSRIAWYLAPNNPTEREQLFLTVKRVYNARSHVVHGSDYIKKEPEIRDHLEIVEDLNSKVFASLLSRNHIAQFSAGKNHRITELRKLGLGISSEFEPSSAIR